MANTQPGGSPPDGGGGSPPGGGTGSIGGGSSSSSSVTYSGATSITSAGTYSNQTYTSSTADENSVLVSLASGTVNLVSPTVTKSGDSDGGDNCNFYGINSAVMATGGGTVSITGGTVTADAKGANGVFSYGGNGGTNGAAGDGTTIIISDTTIKTTGDNGGGIMTTGGGVTKASNLTITTTGQSSAPIRTDRGGGYVTVSGGSYTSSGLGSPAVYCTADIVVENATLTSNLSEGVCIEGQNSVALTDCTLTANNTKTNGNAQFLDAVILYQSQSGDAADGTSTFSMTGGTLINKSGHIFHVTNTTAIINLNGVTINDSGDGVLLSVCDDGWSGASNIATLNASGQELTGDILVGDDSTLTLNLTSGAKLTGNISGTISNNAGTSISTTVGTVNVTLDDDSKWYLQGDTYISSFSGTAANIITNGYTLYVNNTALAGTTETETSDTVVTALNIANSVNSTLIEGTAYGDTINNSGSKVTISAGEGDDSIVNSGANVSISAGDGNDTIDNTASKVTISGGAGVDAVSNSGTSVLVNTTAGNDVITNGGQLSTIITGAGDDVINNLTKSVTISAGSGNDTIMNWGDSVSIDAGAGNDFLTNNKDYVTINAGAGDDSISSTGENALLIYTSGNDSISGFSSTSTLSIGGSYSSVASGDDIILTVGDDSITIHGGADLATVNILGTLSGGSETTTLDDDSDAKVTLGSGVEVGDASARTTATWLVGNALANTLLGGSDSDSIYGKDGNDYMAGNAGNDYLYGQNGDDTIYGGEGNDTLKGGDGADVFIYDAGNDVIADYASGDKISLGADVTGASLSGSNAVLKFADGALTVKNAAELTLIDAGGTEFTTIIGSTTLDDDSDAKVTLASGVATGDASSRTTAIWLVGNALANTLLGGSGSDSLYGKDGADYLSGNAGNDYLYGQNGDDTIYGGEGNDTLKGGDGADTFIYDAGNDVIADYASGDKISLGADVTGASLSGSNAVLKFADGSLTVKNAAELTLIDSTGTELTTIIGSTTLDDDSDAKVTLGSGVATGDASARTTALWLVGNALANTLLGGSDSDSIYGKNGNDYLAGNAGNDYLHGQNGDDTLWGGAGNDTLKGGDGADTFIHDAGTDIIADFADDDLLQIADGWTATVNTSAKTIAITAGDDSLTLKNYTATTFSINGDAYTISGTKLMRNA